jgi:hypothetical protein
VHNGPEVDQSPVDRRYRDCQDRGDVVRRHTLGSVEHNLSRIDPHANQGRDLDDVARHVIQVPESGGCAM